MKVKEESEKVGLKLNIQKTKIMVSGPIISWQIDAETMETVIDFISVVPDVWIPEREERRPLRQCNWQKGEVYYWLEPGPSAASNTVVQVRELQAQAVTQIYRVSTRRWFKQIGYKFAKQFHWSKLSRGGTFLGVSAQFLICTVCFSPCTLKESDMTKWLKRTSCYLNNLKEFPNSHKWKALSRVWLFAIPWTIESIEFSRPEYLSGQSFPSPGDHPNPGIKPRSPALQVVSLPAEPQGKPKNTEVGSLSLLQWNFLTQEIKLGSPALQADSLPAELWE